MRARRALVGLSPSLCLYVFIVPSQWRTRSIEDSVRLENKSRDIEDS